MAKLCECCGNKNNSFVKDPVYLGDDKILCYKCAAPIREELDLLYYVKTKDQFDALSDSILKKCKTLFNDNITREICLVINKRCKNLDFSVEIAGIEKITADEENVSLSTYNSDSDSEGMFGNIGGKIKALAQVITWIGIIGSVIGGISVIAISEYLMLTGLLIMIIGSLISWVSSFVLYGFGHLIENTDKLVKSLKK